MYHHPDDLYIMYLVQPVEVYVDDDTKLTLHGLSQHYLKLREEQKNRKLIDLLDALDFNQVYNLLSSTTFTQVSPVPSKHETLTQCCFNAGSES